MSDCKATLRIGDSKFPCDMESPHSGWAHSNKEAGAIWCSDGEARACARRAKKAKANAN